MFQETLNIHEKLDACKIMLFGLGQIQAIIQTVRHVTTFNLSAKKLTVSKNINISRDIEWTQNRGRIGRRTIPLLNASFRVR